MRKIPLTFFYEMLRQQTPNSIMKIELFIFNSTACSTYTWQNLLPDDRQFEFSLHSKRNLELHSDVCFGSIIVGFLLTEAYLRMYTQKCQRDKHILVAMECRVLELFSGIGGMHYALKLSQISGNVEIAADINTTANEVYKHNHPHTKVLNNNIQKFTPEFIKNLNVNTILMSPPCQPFTRVGNQKDVDDRRSDPFVHICQILPELQCIDWILMENVKGFETSKARDMFMQALNQSRLHYQEFILSPTQLGVPNSRHRYYCLARRSKGFSFCSNGILTKLPDTSVVTSEESQLQQVSQYISPDTEDAHPIPEKILQKYFWVLDIACPASVNTMCFTKAYTHYAEGTGSVFCPLDKEAVDKVCSQLQSINETMSIDLIKTLQLRYFTPNEVAKLMCFPVNEFSFPDKISDKSRYRLLGNSINVLVVSKLIKLLFGD